MNHESHVNAKVHLAFTSSTVPLIIFFFIGMVPMSGFIPSPPPAESAARNLTFTQLVTRASVSRGEMIDDV